MSWTIRVGAPLVAALVFVSGGWGGCGGLLVPHGFGSRDNGSDLGIVNLPGCRGREMLRGRAASAQEGQKEQEKKSFECFCHQYPNSISFRSCFSANCPM